MVNILDQLVDRFVGDQVRDQIRVADLIYVSKTELSDHLSMQLATISKAPILESDAATIEMLLSPSTPKAPKRPIPNGLQRPMSHSIETP